MSGRGRLCSIGHEKTGSLKVVTTKLRSGYLPKNGIAHSANTILAEYYDVVTAPDDDRYLLITITVDDAVYTRVKNALPGTRKLGAELRR